MFSNENTTMIILIDDGMLWLNSMIASNSTSSSLFGSANIHSNNWTHVIRHNRIHLL